MNGRSEIFVIILLVVFASVVSAIGGFSIAKRRYAPHAIEPVVLKARTDTIEQPIVIVDGKTEIYKFVDYQANNVIYVTHPGYSVYILPINNGNGGNGP